ncbi:hypothetical protein SLOPH_2490 [Spraguea lophii 42_110]|uniref:RING-type domain-containing protein n=1 Tax=Spraguea lophii (strain 42_110) TaxID=1358809 RepID=S7WAH5_SPRLO|nr:hypothetical protein SLOPH_2490 [Spraguea lophii 42_110]
MNIYSFIFILFLNFERAFGCIENILKSETPSFVKNFPKSSFHYSSIIISPEYIKKKKFHDEWAIEIRLLCDRTEQLLKKIQDIELKYYTEKIFNIIKSMEYIINRKLRYLLIYVNKKMLKEVRCKSYKYLRKILHSLYYNKNHLVKKKIKYNGKRPIMELEKLHMKFYVNINRIFIFALMKTSDTLYLNSRIFNVKAPEIFLQYRNLTIEECAFNCSCCNIIFSENEYFVYLFCGHFFHSECILGCINIIMPRCPICREDVWKRIK